MADILCQLMEPKDRYLLAKKAIDSYLHIPVSQDMFQKDWKFCWTRVITLMLKFRYFKDSDGIWSHVERVLLTTLYDVKKPNGSLALDIVDVLKNQKPNSDLALKIAEKLALLAYELDEDTEQAQIIIARDLFCEAQAWFAKAKEPDREIEMLVQVAQTQVREGQTCIQRAYPSFGAAAGFYASAIQACQKIPNKFRNQYGIDQRMQELSVQMKKYQQRSLGELKEIPESEWDLKEQMELSGQAVQNKKPVEALQIFTCIVPLVDYQKAREHVLAELKTSSLWLSEEVWDGSDGRVIAKVPGFDSRHDPEGDENKDRLDWEITKKYRVQWRYRVEAFIRPALAALVKEHSFREEFFFGLARSSPLVPRGRERLVGKALFAGYSSDFLSAAHLLIPQFEHIVRCQLTAKGVETIRSDEDRVQSERGLSSLVVETEMTTIFGESLAFELKALFAAKNGPNLRNDLAHGLMDDGAFQSIEVIYAWWLGLRMIGRAVWNIEGVQG